MDFDFLIPIAFFATVIIIFKLIFDYRLKSQMIASGLSKEEAEKIFRPDPRTTALNQIRWGLILASIGVALLFPQIFPEISEGTVIGLMLVFTGVAFLIYYGISTRFFAAAPENKRQEIQQSEDKP